MTSKGPQPSLKQMLEVADSCGLTSVQEAHDNYIRHSDLFFYLNLESYTRQHNALVAEMVAVGLIKDQVIIDAKIKDYI